VTVKLPTTSEKCHHTTLWNAEGTGILFSSKCWWFWKETGCHVWQLECEASNVTTSVQSVHLLHGHTFPVFFAIDQSHRPPRSAEIQPTFQQTCTSVLGDGRISAHADPTSTRRANLICPTWSHQLEHSSWARWPILGFWGFPAQYADEPPCKIWRR